MIINNKIGFGSSTIRDTGPISIKSATPFMRKFLNENFTNLGPGCYDMDKYNKAIVIKNFSSKNVKTRDEKLNQKSKTISKRTLLKSNLNTEKCEKSSRKFVSFSQEKRFPRQKLIPTPGPGYYEPSKTYSLTIEEDFGHQRLVKPPVKLKCIPTAIDKDICEICGQKPAGDYWKKGSHYVCMQCFCEELEEKHKYERNQLKEFQLIRDCSQIHRHLGGKVIKISDISKRHFREKRWLETYLSNYFNKLPSVNTELFSKESKEVSFETFKNTLLFHIQNKKKR